MLKSLHLTLTTAGPGTLAQRLFQTGTSSAASHGTSMHGVVTTTVATPVGTRTAKLQVVCAPLPTPVYTERKGSSWKAGLYM
ncbi:hypothetical protein ATCV1_z807R [Acanthocystis turfacea chlorella virus 1]|uniref:Uncharacterized protein z807R n=1 Tax=Chlorovirus heliozoae TaxID=322019 RepID=A7KA67_9PHYC|nr:hypothetical protein ATCV1_z807R [Acanthocystis turfacea chlorella virus 1]ABT16941.1 hypothetical protein ATCV1_z807R [Acanthocystis turfacea chlorella virus 1]